MARTRRAILLAVVLASSLATGCASIEPQIASLRNDNELESDEYPVEVNLVVIKREGVSPETIAIRPGETVTFENTAQGAVTVVSDPYPERDRLPELYSGKIYTGEDFRFTFSQKGEFGFHLEENPSIKGKVVVR